jgi:hypothetical protein
MRLPLLPPHLPLPLRKWPLVEPAPGRGPGHPGLHVDLGYRVAKFKRHYGDPAEMNGTEQAGSSECNLGPFHRLDSVNGLKAAGGFLFLMISGGRECRFGVASPR